MTSQDATGAGSLSIATPSSSHNSCDQFLDLTVGEVHRLDPGIVPFRKATECQIHVSGGEFNAAANLADCFGSRPA
jgi:2-dehydro-3-deoxygluconokinase